MFSSTQEIGVGSPMLCFSSLSRNIWLCTRACGAHQLPRASLFQPSLHNGSSIVDGLCPRLGKGSSASNKVYIGSTFANMYTSGDVRHDQGLVRPATARDPLLRMHFTMVGYHQVRSMDATTSCPLDLACTPSLSFH